MITFILNDTPITTDKPSGTILLDFIRYHQSLMGTKIGCREGDCGACTIMVGDIRDGQLHYESMTSCLTPIGNAQGKHIVTIEGFNGAELTPVQEAMVEEGGTQCGFCTVGFVVSLQGFCLSSKPLTYENAIAAIDGNICRCTGYKSIERAAQRIVDHLETCNSNDKMDWLVAQGYLPAYFKTIQQRIEALQATRPKPSPPQDGKLKPVGGGTDLYVQRPAEMRDATMSHFLDERSLKGITRKGDKIHIGAASTAEELRSSAILLETIPRLFDFMKLVSSTPIRNMGTVAGNFVNASPIGDLTIFFLGMNASIVLSKTGGSRTIALKDFYQGYKVLDKQPGEILEKIIIDVPKQPVNFNFEKVCKRTHLDIATVNSALLIQVENDTIISAHASAGGVGPTPKYLQKTCDFLKGKPLTATTIQEANEVIQGEISPISDARGTQEYKRLLLRQLFYAHFLTLFPNKIQLTQLV